MSSSIKSTISTTSTPAITLYRGFPSSGQYVWSPFVNKLEARFRFAGLPYASACGSPFQGPKGKIPYIGIPSTPSSETGTETETRFLGDSTFIVAHLVEEGKLLDLNARLEPTERVRDLAIRALLEDKLYFYQNYEKWHQNYYTMRSHILSALPYPLQIIIGLLAYRKMKATLYGQGVMRYTDSEIATLRREIWEGINVLLETSRSMRKSKGDGGGDGKSGDDGTPFWVLGGEEPTEADATVFGFVVAVLICDAGPDSRKLVKSFPAIVDYARRIHDTFYPDFALWE